MPGTTEQSFRPPVFVGLLGVLVGAVVAGTVAYLPGRPAASPASPTPEPGPTAPAVASSEAPAPAPARIAYQPRKYIDISGFSQVLGVVQTWKVGASLEEVSRPWHQVGFRAIEHIDMRLTDLLLSKAAFYNSEGEPDRAYQALEQARALVESREALAAERLYSVIFCQGITALRSGETENCIHCRGESSCILPIAPAAVHTRPAGSRRAIKHFTEYLQRFPDDLEARWLLNLAYMTLGEHPHKVDPAYLVLLDRWLKCEFDIGKFRDVGHLVGVNRFNQAGGACMDDFDNDGLLDLAVTTWDATMPMVLYRNKGDGAFEDRTAAAGLTRQLGGLYCVQADYNNDGHLDLYIPRGAWLQQPIRPSLLRNNGDGTFTDVTDAAGLDYPRSSISAAWADYDNDGWLDLLVCCEGQPNLLFRNKGDGTFDEVGQRARIWGKTRVCKGVAWIDYDNDRYPDLFVNDLAGTAELFHNNRDGTFTETSLAQGIRGPQVGFSCWAWDYDNDGWLDLFATSYDRSLEDVVKGLLGQPHGLQTSRLYRNRQGQGFEDVTKEAGLDMVFATMGSNFADFDNDGYLDMYLGTGDPNISMLVPKRMFKNVAGRRFAEITASSGTGHLQKGHAVACGDWDRDGDLDIFMETGGAINGDKYHNVLFQNPGQGNHWLSVKLVGKKSNRSAIGARIKVVTAGAQPLTIHRHVTSGSSFGANPLEQMIGLAKAERVALLEIHWPTSGTTQVFRDLAVNQAIEVTELAADYRPRNWKPIAVPK